MQDVWSMILPTTDARDRPDNNIHQRLIGVLISSLGLDGTVD